MNAGTKLATFAAALAVVFGSALAVGAAVAPIDVGGDAGHDASNGGQPAAIDTTRGLAVAQSGYRFMVETTTVSTSEPTTFAFRIVDDFGVAAVDFVELHERPLHLILLSRNLVDYAHLHPTMDAEGRWTVDLPALSPGSYRVFADFQPAGGQNLTLGTDLSVPGNVESVALPLPVRAITVDGYTVSLAGTPQIGDSELSFDVALDGEQVRTDSYLGAAGHLVAIRVGDLAYLHVHPHEGDESEMVAFTGEFPTAGSYRLFFDFSHDGVVRSASFTIEVPHAMSSGSTPDAHDEGH